MKNALVISLLLLLFINQVGHLMVFHVQQMIIKEAQHELLIGLLPEKEFKKIPDNKLIMWEEAGKEFHFNNKMYDVAKTNFINGKKVYLVLEDANEQKLLLKYSTLLAKQLDNSAKRKGQELVLKFTPSIFICEENEARSKWSTLLQKKTIFDEYYHSEYTPSILIPPPQQTT